jgi:2-succinyl-5-enolpyruvyl-6-hydroxy-3-cyclohexene-1-carboxylate synthase
VNLGDVNLACATALVDALARAGMRHACVSPGSRSTPLALAVARHPEVAAHVHLDERSSGFVALGIARAVDGLVGVLTTSGTAAAELLPAAVEASQSRIPLVLLTADRPPRLRGTGANQTIDQVELFGRYARAYLEPPPPASLDDAPAWERAAVDAVRAAIGDPAGPAHVNCPFEEPLVPTPGWRTPRVGPVDRGADEGRREARTTEFADVIARASARLSGTEHGAVIAGTSRAAPDIAGFAAGRGWPMLADPTSNARMPSPPSGGGALAAGQALIGVEAWAKARAPDLVVVLGAAPTSRATNRFLGWARDILVVGAHELDPVPEHPDAERIPLPPAVLFAAEPSSGAVVANERSDWAEAWFTADAIARRSLDEVLDAEDEPTGLRTARDVAAAIPDGGIFLIGNSMPVRELDVAMAPRTGLRVVGNRGASGIDGLVSTAIGLATASVGPTFALIGDLTYLYDLSSLAWTGAHEPPDLTVVVLNNGRGEIFATLGQDAIPERDRFFTTPHGADLGALTRAGGVQHVLVERARELPTALAHASGLRVVEVRVDPEHDRAVRGGVGRAVSDAIGRLG